MAREYFMETRRLGFGWWEPDDIALARLLWGDPQVSRYICASGTFSEDEIRARLETEIRNGHEHGVQYWPVFELATRELVGCCGLRPHGERSYELGFHLRPTFWGRGLATEAASAAITHAFCTLRASSLFAGHNPNNAASARVLAKLGFSYTGDEYYKPTGLYHPSYQLCQRSWNPSQPIVRPLQPEDDPEAVGSVYVRSWKWAYAGIVAQAFLDSLAPDAWASRFEQGKRSMSVAAVGEELVGATGFGAARDNDRRGWGEVYSIYVVPERAGDGIGRMLLSSALWELARKGFAKAYLWILEDNARARGFYEHLGLTCSQATRSISIGGKQLREVCYEIDLSPLAG